jgi:riboflavin kinase/FMN adenylyltransferase
MSLWFWDATTELPPVLRHGAVTIGNFDAVHRGHQELAARVRTWANRLQGPALAVTFDPPPHQVLHPGSERPPLTTLEERAYWFQQAGVDHLIALHTTRELLSWEAEEFFQRVLVGRLQARAMVEGSDFRFGRQRRGDVTQLAQWCLQAGCHFEVVPPVLHEGAPISSSRVRQALEWGEVALAWSLLARPYSVTGQVVEGARRGQSLGFPTANLDGVKTLLPADGVYVVRVSAHSWYSPLAGAPKQQEETPRKEAESDALERGSVACLGRRIGAAHIGPNPTFEEQQRKLEVHLIDFQGNLYGQSLRIEFLARLRGTRRFDSVEELKDQLRRDIEAARQWMDHADQAAVITRENPG